MKKWLSVLVVLAACGGGGTPEQPSRIYGGDRQVELQLPANYDPSQTYPLIMVLHGYGATGLLQTAVFQLGDVATDPGAFFLAPNGTVDQAGFQFWNARAACCNLYGSDVDDVGYLGGLIDDVSADWPVDPARVYVIGHSNGAFMTYRMACDRADVITAAVALAGAPPTIDGSDCAPAQPVSLVHMHGTADDTIPYAGATGDYPFLGAVESSQLWADKDGCDGAFSAAGTLDLDRNLAGDETQVAKAGCPSGVDVELWTIEGAGHVPDFNATIGTTITDWLMAHPRE